MVQKLVVRHPKATMVVMVLQGGLAGGLIGALVGRIV